MSQAFVKEGDSEWLSDIAPTEIALTRFLTRENNGIRVFTKSARPDAKGRMVYEMSNSLSYMLDEENKWLVVL